MSNAPQRQGSLSTLLSWICCRSRPRGMQVIMPVFLLSAWTPERVQRSSVQYPILPGMLGGHPVRPVLAKDLTPEIMVVKTLVTAGCTVTSC